jgi:predicted ArsR family transcriptional regulator
VSASGGLSSFAGELLIALRSEPLDVDQLAAALGVIPAAVMAELEGLMEARVVHPVTVDSGRQAWGLTVKGWSRIGGGFGVES